MKRGWYKDSNRIYWQPNRVAGNESSLQFGWYQVHNLHGTGIRSSAPRSVADRRSGIRLLAGEWPEWLLAGSALVSSGTGRRNGQGHPTKPDSLEPALPCVQDECRSSRIAAVVAAIHVAASSSTGPRLRRLTGGSRVTLADQRFAVQRQLE